METTLGRYLIALVVTLLPAPALAQIGGAYVAPQQADRFIDDDMQRQIETVDERTAAGTQSDPNSGERLVCRRATHRTESRMSRAPRICLTAREWRRRQ